MYSKLVGIYINVHYNYVYWLTGLIYNKFNKYITAIHVQLPVI